MAQFEELWLLETRFSILTKICLVVIPMYERVLITRTGIFIDNIRAEKSG